LTDPRSGVDISLLRDTARLKGRTMPFKPVPQARLAVVAAAVALLASVPLGVFAQASRAAGEARVIVAFKPGAAAAVRAAIARSGGHVSVDLSEVRALAVALPTAAVAALRRNPQIEYVEDDVERHALALSTPSGSPYAAGQLVPYGIAMVQADQVSDGAASNRRLCIVDSGYETAHEDLAGNIVAGKNFTRSGAWFTDESSHGTHVGGTVSAVNHAGIGVVGVMPNKFISLYIAKVFDATGSAPSSVINRAALDCVSAGANVISLSLGGAGATRTDERVFDKIAASNVLSVAAAGNDGTSGISYPAGYASVMSVAAVDDKRAWAPFSQFNATVEIAAPGVEVLSSVPMGSGREVALTIANKAYVTVPMDGTPAASVVAPLANFGTGETLDVPVAGKVCLIQRGNISFAQKVLNCQASGGVGAVIYNNVAGALYGTLGGAATTVPSTGASDTDGAAMLRQIGDATSLAVTATNYAYFNGTSMATPHVSAVAALVWSHHPNCSASQIRSSLTKSARDIEGRGRDDKTGFGLVQAKDAVDRIAAMGCGN
jgi:subtilisin family serine protease